MSFHSKTERNYTTHSEMETGKKDILTGFFLMLKIIISVLQKNIGGFCSSWKKIHIKTFHEISDKIGNYFNYVGLLFLLSFFFFFF